MGKKSRNKGNIDEDIKIMREEIKENITSSKSVNSKLKISILEFSLVFIVKKIIDIVLTKEKENKDVDVDLGILKYTKRGNEETVWLYSSNKFYIKWNNGELVGINLFGLNINTTIKESYNLLGNLNHETKNN